MLGKKENFKIKNDLPRLKESALLYKVSDNTQFSFSYLLMLVSSSIICTLGLLLDNTALVIGGMIIAPLMWPLLKISIGISFDNKLQLRKAIKVLLLSVAIGFASAYVIALISPIKQLNTEILSRATPTLLDLVVALVAGAVAAFAIMRPKISENLAGVAIAAALMPPLSVAGIGLAFANMGLFFGSALLFFINIVAIIFISIFVFAFLVNRLHPEDILKRKGVVFVLFALVLTSIPLFFFLRSYSFEVSAYPKVETSLREGLTQISPSIYLSSIKVTIDSPTEVTINAEVLVPEDVTINHAQQKDLVSELGDVLGREVDLYLRVQRNIAIVTQEKTLNVKIKEKIGNAFTDTLSEYYPGILVDSIDIYPSTGEGKAWLVSSVLRGGTKILFTASDLSFVEDKVEGVVGEEVLIEVDLIPRAKLKAGDSTSIEADIRRQTSFYIKNNFPSVTLEDVILTSNGDNSYIVQINILGSSENVKGFGLVEFEETLEETHSVSLDFELYVTEQNIIKL